MRLHGVKPLTSRMLKPKATVTSNDNQRDGLSILNATLKDKLIEPAVLITDDDDAFSLWIIENSSWIYRMLVTLAIL